jgi:hypothetical protein
VFAAANRAASAAHEFAVAVAPGAPVLVAAALGPIGDASGRSVQWPHHAVRAHMSPGGTHAVVDWNGLRE